MATTPILKLQPQSNVYLRGFDRRGAAAALHHASDTGFTVSGVWRDQADFAVVVLYDSDNTFEHYSRRYLPNFDLSGLILTFDLQTSGTQPIDSKKFNWIDWKTIDVIKEDGTSAQISLPSCSTQVGGTHAAASGTFTLINSNSVPGDRVTLWFQNIAFDYTVPVGVANGSSSDVLQGLADQVNGFQYAAANAPIGLTAAVQGDSLTLTASTPGSDGNMIVMYELHQSDRLRFAEQTVQFSGGTSDAIWRIRLDFTQLGIPHVRQMWMTLAPPLANGAALTDTEFQVAVSNWTVDSSSGDRSLHIAGPGSVRVSSQDAWVSYTGVWATEAGWFQNGFARHSNLVGNSVAISYICQSPHNLYLGTSLYGDRGSVSVQLDGDAVTDLACSLAVEPALITRRLLRENVGAGKHSVQLEHTGAGHFYFDFLEAVVPNGITDSSVTFPNAMPATDFDTDITYKLSPQRLVSLLHGLGFRGQLNHYLGVFWWNQRTRVDGVFPKIEAVFGGQWSAGDEAFLVIGGVSIGKSVFPGDSSDTIAAHFAYFINENFVGIWAIASGALLTVTSRSPEWTFDFSSTVNSAQGSLTVTGSLQTGTEGVWQVDAAQTPVLNRAARDWHSDLYNELAAHGLTAVTSVSMELLNPPDAAPTTVWSARFPDGTAVATDTGFASLKSTHCAFVSAVATFQAAVYSELAGLMEQAGLTPWLQFGEFLWWYFSNFNSSTNPGGGMAYYDAETSASALRALGRPLHLFETPNADPSVEAFADADFLSGRMAAHISQITGVVLAHHPNAKFELLWPYDVNYPEVTSSGLGGRLNRYVNLPVMFQQKSGSGLDRIKMEALAFGAVERNFDRARETIRRPLIAPFAWSPSDCAYLVPWFNGGCAWQREFLCAQQNGLEQVSFWALDHLCLLGWLLPLPQESGTGQYL